MLIYRVHVSLVDIEPPIWRSIELSSQTTLKQFHRILQIAMGWENYHLHEFIVDGQRYGIPDPNYEPGDVIAEGLVRIAEVLPVPREHPLYIRLRGLLAARRSFGFDHLRRTGNGVSPSRGWARHCPPEDCGGTSGYADLTEILMDPTHEEYEHMRKWTGKDFYVEEFSINKVTKRLRRNRSLASKA